MRKIRIACFGYHLKIWFTNNGWCSPWLSIMDYLFNAWTKKIYIPEFNSYSSQLTSDFFSLDYGKLGILGCVPKRKQLRLSVTEGMLQTNGENALWRGLPIFSKQLAIKKSISNTQLSKLFAYYAWICKQLNAREISAK